MHRAVTKNEKTMEANQPREFIRLLMENERRIHAYLYTLVGNHADAEDLLQETSIVLWDKFHEFDQQHGNFVAWSFKVAFFLAQNHRRKKARSKVHFSEEVSQAIATKSLAIGDRLDQRQDLLAECIKKLAPNDQQLLRLRYQTGLSIETTVQKSGRTKNAIYKALSRIRGALSDCVKRQMVGENF